MTVASDEKTSENCLVVNCLVEGMPLNLATLSHGNTFKTDVGGEECSIHPSSVLFGHNLANRNSASNTTNIFNQKQG